MLYFDIQEQAQEELEKRVDSWIKLMDEKRLSQQKEAFEELKSAWTHEVPF